MPPLPKTTICKICKCATENADGYCDNHRDKKAKKVAQKVYDHHRGSPSKRGYDSHWVKIRAQFLREHPLCVRCEKEFNILTPAVEIHHIKRLRDGGDRFDESTLCRCAIPATPT